MGRKVGISIRSGVESRNPGGPSTIQKGKLTWQPGMQLINRCTSARADAVFKGSMQNIFYLLVMVLFCCPLWLIHNDESCWVNPEQGRRICKHEFLASPCKI